jgi:hypothetical protein
MFEIREKISWIFNYVIREGFMELLIVYMDLLGGNRAVERGKRRSFLPGPGTGWGPRFWVVHPGTKKW